MRRRLCDALRRHGYILPSVAVVLLTFYWFVTQGSGRLFDTDPEGSYADHYYDVLAGRLLQGRLDVPPEAIQWEAFVHDGKYYGYFGLVPAVMRLPLVALFPGSGIMWGPASALLACAVNLAGAYWILCEVEQLLSPEGEPSSLRKGAHCLFVLIIGLGSTNIFLGSRAFMHHEAHLWGGAFALLFYAFFLTYLRVRTTGVLLAACACSALSLHSRPVPGAGTLLCLGLFVAVDFLAALRKGSRRPGRLRWLDPARLLGLDALPVRARQSWLVVALATLAVMVYFRLNYVRFGTIEGAPLRMYNMLNNPNAWGYDAEAVRRIEGKQFHFSNFPTDLYNYVWPGKVIVFRRFPWFSCTDQGTEFPGAKIYQWVHFSSLTATNPALFALSLIGLGLILTFRSPVRVLRLPVLATLAVCGLMLCCVAVNERFKHDFFPFLVLTGAAGLSSLLVLARRRPRVIWPAGLLLVALAVWSVAASLGCSLVYQRVQLPGCNYPAKWVGRSIAELEEMQRAVERLIPYSPDSDAH
jgi:hypothetical protein